jgi:3-hydroxyacyl-CoA dehydrogenase
VPASLRSLPRPGHPVLLFDVRPDAAGRALQNIDLALQRMVAKGKVTEADRRALTGRIAPDRYRVSPLLRRKMFSGGRFL